MTKHHLGLTDAPSGFRQLVGYKLSEWTDGDATVTFDDRPAPPQPFRRAAWRRADDDHGRDRRLCRLLLPAQGPRAPLGHRLADHAVHGPGEEGHDHGERASCAAAASASSSPMPRPRMPRATSSPSARASTAIAAAAKAPRAYLSKRTPPARSAIRIWRQRSASHPSRRPLRGLLRMRIEMCKAKRTSS